MWLEEEEEIVRLRRVIRDRENPVQIYGDDKFRERFGFKKESVYAMERILRPFKQHRTQRISALSSTSELLCN